MKKVGVITGNISPTSGLGRYSREVVHELTRQGESVSVFSESEVSDVLLGGHKKVLSMLRNLILVRGNMKQIDIVHALDVWPFAIYGLLGVLGTKKKFYINGVGTYSIPPARFSIKRLLMLAAYRRSQHVFCISEYTRSRIVERVPFPLSVSVVHLAATLLPKPSPKVTLEVMSRHNIPVNAKVILTVGGIKDRKGQLDTLRGVIKARRSTPDLMYVIVGDSTDSTYLRTLEEEARKYDADDSYRIVTDASSDEDLSVWYTRASIFALTSNNSREHFEGFGLVFLEAAQFGVPCIGTKGCGIEDAIANGETGILVPQRDPESIEVAIEQILSHRSKYSVAARNFFQKFSWAKTVVKYPSIYYTEH